MAARRGLAGAFDAGRISRSGGPSSAGRAEHHAKSHKSELRRVRGQLARARRVLARLAARCTGLNLPKDLAKDIASQMAKLDQVERMLKERKKKRRGA